MDKVGSGNPTLNGPVSFGQLFTVGCGTAATLSRYLPHATAQRHRHEQPYVCVVLEGGFSQNAETERMAMAGDLVVLPSGIWHSDQVGPVGALCLNLHLADTDADDLLTRRGATEPEARRLAIELAAEIAIGADRDALVMESLAAELKQSLRRTGLSRGKNVVADVIALIESAPSCAWSLGALAAQVDRHPTHLAREFRRWTGVGIGTFRRHRALVQLCLELRSSDRSLAELALIHGFADQAHMTRTLRRFTGFAPGRYRRLFWN